MCNIGQCTPKITTFYLKSHLECISHSVLLHRLRLVSYDEWTLRNWMLRAFFLPNYNINLSHSSAIVLWYKTYDTLAGRWVLMHSRALNSNHLYTCKAWCLYVGFFNSTPNQSFTRNETARSHLWINGALISSNLSYFSLWSFLHVFLHWFLKMNKNV